MALFSSKTIKFSSASFTELVPENDLPDTIRTSILGSILRKQGATSNLINDINQGPPVLLQRLYRLAENGHYPYGLPSSIVLNRSSVESGFSTWLENHVGIGVIVDYAYFRPFNERHNVWKKLIEDYSYVEATNILNAAPLITNSYTQYIQDMIIVLDGSVPTSGDPLEPNTFTPHDPSTHEDWETPAKNRAHPWRGDYPGSAVQTIYDPNGTTGAFVDVIWSTTGDLADTVVERVFIERDPGDPDTEFFQAKYYFDDGSGIKPYYFTYNPADNTYPALNALIGDAGSNTAEFLPFLHIRSDYEDLTDIANTTTEDLKQLKRAFDLIGIDMYGLSEQIHDNPDIDVIVQAAVGFYFKLNTESVWGKKYIFHFFKWLFEEGFTNSNDISSVKIGDELLDLNLRFGDITYSGEQTGSVLPIGDYSITVEDYTVNETVIIGVGNPPENVEYTRHGIRLRHQTNSNTYVDYFVEDITMLFEVPGKSVSGTLDNFGDDDFNILIPVSRILTKNVFKFREQEKVYYASMGLLITTFQTAKLKWYQRPEFIGFMQIVGVVVAIVSLGTSIKASLALNTALGGAGSVLTVVAITILKVALTGIILDYSFKFIVKELGADVGTGLAILTLLWGGGKLFQTGGFTNPQALTLLNVSNIASKHSFNELKKDIQNIYNSMGDDQAEYEETLQSIEDKKMELGLIRDNLIDPRMFLDHAGSLMDPNESIDSWLNKGIHLGNIGTLVLAYPTNYVEMMLQLPTVDFLER